MNDRISRIRIASAILWLFAGWYLGNLAAFQFGLSDLFGPVLGVTAAVVVAGDPLGLLWSRARTAAPPPATDLAPTSD